jgi:hypothetical protein
VGAPGLLSALSHGPIPVGCVTDVSRCPQASQMTSGSFGSTSTVKAFSVNLPSARNGRRLDDLRGLIRGDFPERRLWPFSRVVDNKASVGSLTYNGFLVFLDWCLGTLFGKMTTNELASHRKRTG